LKILSLVAKWIFVLCIPLLLLSSSLAWAFNSKWLYNYGFIKYNVSQQTGFSTDELDTAAKGLIEYFNSGDEYVHINLNRDGKSVELFTREEQFHFKDVKQLIRIDYLFLIITLILVLIYALFCLYWRKGTNRRNLAKSMIWGCGLSILLILIIGISSFFDFDQLFLQFHYLVFSNQYWSAQGYMLLLFPGGFWYDAALICGAIMATLAIVLGGVSIIYFRLKKNEI
jgi:integral membrane protein (TIGR01906 family)